MCGIGGQIVRGDRPLDPARLVAAARALLHRGPDDLGFLGWNGVGVPRLGRDADVATGARIGFLHRRLSILDLSPAGWQPMSSADGRFHLVFNGEIYNYRELRSELEALGHRFRSACDSEVLLAAYQQWEEQALTRFIGMFAFAVLDTTRRSVLLARDFFGIKPLYYHRRDDGFAFASEIKALLALTQAVPRINAARLYDYLRFGITDHSPETFFAEVRLLPAAHYLRIGLDGGAMAEPVRYWDPSSSSPAQLSFEDASLQLRDLFLSSVRLHLRSDVPVGTALSGGIDSSSIVCAMRRVEGDRLDIHAVSYFAQDPSISEAQWIEIAAQKAGASVHRVVISPEELARDLERLISVQEEPFGSTSIYAQYAVFRCAAEAGLKVMLDGQGADEMLAGYRYHLAGRLVSLLYRMRWVEAARLFRNAQRLPGNPGREVLDSLAFHLLPVWAHDYARRIAGKPFVPAWLRQEWFRDKSGFATPIHQIRGAEALREQMLATLGETSLPMLLHWEDRSSMAFSIESRVPFLTPQLASFVFSLPEEYLVATDGTTKAVFRAAMRGIVPDPILDRRDKIGFASPELAWLKHLRAWVEGILGSEAARRIPVLNLEAAREEWIGILDGGRRFDWHVWRWINLVRWAEQFSVSFDA